MNTPDRSKKLNRKHFKCSVERRASLFSVRSKPLTVVFAASLLLTAVDTSSAKQENTDSRQATATDRPMETKRAGSEQTETAPVLGLNTEKGPIFIRLYPSAAPKTIAKLEELVNTPAKSGESSGEKADKTKVRPHNLFDGISFMYTLPHVEIRTSLPKGLEDLRIPKEINAESLGLDKKTIKDPVEAMNTYQFKIMKQYSKNKKNPTPKLKNWLQQFQKQGNADFLVGVSEKELNEALGYHYEKGIVSYPVKKGSVMLKPASNSDNKLQLVIALDDLPTRTGHWCVIGEVVKGLEIAEKISVLPNSGMKKPRYKPVNPVKITQAEVRYMK